MATKEKAVEAPAETTAKPAAMKTVRIAIPAPEGARRDESGRIMVAPVEVWINGAKTVVPVGEPVEVAENVHEVLRSAGRV